jgi:2',3'-cyclic-nucleotide 2'-phosphodiesterase (5'-nucleotidase family)
MMTAYGSFTNSRCRCLHRPMRQRQRQCNWRSLVVAVLVLLLCCIVVVAVVGSVDDNNDNIYYEPKLPWGDINVLVVTDVHSWVGGHNNGHSSHNSEEEEEVDSVNYGHVHSLVEHVRAYIANQNPQDGTSTDSPPPPRDVWFVMNGDWIDGTGLAMNGDASFLIPILEKMPFDAITVGNHELYQSSVIRYMTRTAGLTEYFGRHYISSNVHFAGTKRPLGVHCTILKGHHRLLVLGFLYNMVGYANQTVTVQDVQQVVSHETWFSQAVSATDDYDAILVLAHMDVRDELVSTILSALRKYAGDGMPVQFVTGHTHTRDYAVLDRASTSVEAGKYLDTVGFTSFPVKQTLGNSDKVASGVAATLLSSSGTNNVTQTQSQPQQPQAPHFDHYFINGTVSEFVRVLGLTSAEQLATPSGVELSQFIERIQIELGLRQVIGCVLQPYYINDVPVDNANSIWGLFRDKVVPWRFADFVPPSNSADFANNNNNNNNNNKNHTTSTSNNPVAVLLNSGTFRYDLYAGDVTVDNVIAVSPYNNTMLAYTDVPASLLRAALHVLETIEPPWLAAATPNYIVSTTDTDHDVSPDDEQLYTLVVDEFEYGTIDATLRSLLVIEPVNGTVAQTLDPAIPLPGITTTSIWLDYIRHTSDHCPMSKDKKHSWTGGSSSNSGTSSHGTKPSSGTNASEDSARLSWLGMALVIMVVLGGLAIYQKSADFEQRLQQRQFAILAAAAEYNDNEDDSGDDDDDDDSRSAYCNDIENDASDNTNEESEGRFV